MMFPTSACARSPKSFAAAFLSLALAQVAANEPPIEHTPVFVSGQGPYHTYRIPSLLVTGRGSLLAFCEGRREGRGDAGDIDLLLRRSDDGGRVWGDFQIVWDDGPNTCGNPCPVIDAEGRIHLLMTRNLGDDSEAEIKSRTGRGSRTVWICRSEDDGVTWSTPREITSEVKRADWAWYATGPGVGIRIVHGEHAGRLVIPCDHSLPDPSEKLPAEREYGAHVLFSDDGGETWRIGEALRPGMNECQVAELSEPPGGLLLDMRSYRGRSRRAQSTSVDGGATWSEPRDVPALVEPVCQASLIRHSWPDEDHPGLLLFSNPADPKRRVNLTLRASADDGSTWPLALPLHAGPAAYSCLVSLPDGSAACLYERGDKGPYESIVIAHIPAARLAISAGPH